VGGHRHSADNYGIDPVSLQDLHDLLGGLQ